MEYTYKEVLRSSKLTEITFSCDKTATTIQTPKTYALAAIAGINGESTSDFEAISHTESQAGSDTGWICDGKCDVLLNMSYNGTNKQIAKNFQIELIDTSVDDVDDFKAFVLGVLLNYYPTITALTGFSVKSAVINFKD